MPLVPGTEGAVADLKEAMAVAKTISFPILIKAAAGGGGKGMRIRGAGERAEGRAGACHQRSGEHALATAASLSRSSWKGPRHIGGAVLADMQGIRCTSSSVSAASTPPPEGDRGKRPAPCSPGAAEEDGRSRGQRGQSVNYVGAGTVEFLLDANGDFCCEK
ncbi:MAG: hypothetical protein IPO60_05330 [Flavobacteriales bacterium]|nr:hypothetical protein [Flavobacteriales bacterium]